MENYKNKLEKNIKSSQKIIFDLDSTLFFLSDKWIETYNNFINKYNLNTSPHELYSTIGKIETSNFDTYINKDFLINFINSQLSLNFDQEKCKEFLEEYANIPLLKIDIVKDVLSYLSNKYELIAYTDWFTDNQILRLKLNGLDKYFSKVYGWDILPVKPSKKGIEEIIKNNNIKDYIFIGDNLEIDIKLPDSMGMETIFYNRKNITQDKYKEIKNLEDLKNIL